MRFVIFLCVVADAVVPHVRRIHVASRHRDPRAVLRERRQFHVRLSPPITRDGVPTEHIDCAVVAEGLARAGARTEAATGKHGPKPRIEPLGRLREESPVLEAINDDLGAVPDWWRDNALLVGLLFAESYSALVS